MDGVTILDPYAMEFFPVAYALPAPPVYVATAVPEPPPSRAVLLTMVPPQAAEPALRAAMGAFGAVRSIAALVADGAVTVHFFDLRSAVSAVAAVRQQYMQQQAQLANWGAWDPAAAAACGGGGGLVAGHAVWAQFAGRELAGVNQGTVSVFNWNPAVASSSMAELFGSIGDVKEMNETAYKQQKIVEFFDIRAAARAVNELSGREVYGRRIVVEFSRPGCRSPRLNTKNSSPCSAPMPPRLLRANSEPYRPASASAAPKRNAPKIKNRISSNSNGNPSSSRKGARVAGKIGAVESRFCVSIGEEENVESRVKDLRTTVMVKNIPNKYSLKLLLTMLDNHCIHCNERIGEGTDEPLSAYDFVYLPIDFNNKCNVGYGFVNLTTPEAALKLYKAFHSKPWEVFNSRKICEITYARLQGLEALKEHFRNSKFACDNDEYMPAVFSPARDGKQLTEPVSIGGRVAGLTRRAMELHNRADQECLGGASSTTASTQAPSDHGGDEEDEVTEGGTGGRGDETGGEVISEFLKGLSCS